MRVLIIDNNVRKEYWGAADLSRAVLAHPGVTVTVRRAEQDDLPGTLRDFDKVIVSGSITSAQDDSAWVTQLEAFMKRALDEGKPLLGVCFGHQILARALGGASHVGLSATPEFGWSQIEVLEDSKLFEGLPRQFYSFSSHRDEVLSAPPRTRLLAKSARCAVQAIEHTELPAFGIQFHPERLLPEAERSIQEFKATRPKDQILKPKESKKLFNPRVGELVFGNFLRL